MFQRAACLLSELKVLRASTNSTASISLTAHVAASAPLHRVGLTGTPLHVFAFLKQCCMLIFQSGEKVH